MTTTVELTEIDADIILQLFGKDAELASFDATGPKVSFSVSNLGEQSEPLSGDILATGEARNAKTDRQTHYLVRIAGQLASFRIYNDSNENGVTVFAKGQIMEDTTQNEKHALTSIDRLCDC